MEQLKPDGRKNNKGLPGKAGRKPVKDKKIPVQVYYHSSKIDKIGGIEKVRELVLLYLNKLSSKK